MLYIRIPKLTQLRNLNFVHLGQNLPISVSPQPQLDILIHTIYKINSKCIKNLNIRSESIKFLEENLREKKSFLILVWAMIVWIWHQKHKWQQQKWTSGIASNKMLCSLNFESCYLTLNLRYIHSLGSSN